MTVSSFCGDTSPSLRRAAQQAAWLTTGAMDLRQKIAAGGASDSDRDGVCRSASSVRGACDLGVGWNIFGICRGCGLVLCSRCCWFHWVSIGGRRSAPTGCFDRRPVGSVLPEGQQRKTDSCRVASPTAAADERRATLGARPVGTLVNASRLGPHRRRRHSNREGRSWRRLSSSSW